MPREGDTKIRDGYIWEYKLTFVDDEDDEEFEWVNTGVREEVVSESDNAHPDRYATDQEIYDSSITDEEIYEREKLKLESERRRDKARKRIEDEEDIERWEAQYGHNRPPSRLSKILKGIFDKAGNDAVTIGFIIVGCIIAVFFSDAMIYLDKNETIMSEAGYFSSCCLIYFLSVMALMLKLYD